MYLYPPVSHVRHCRWTPSTKSPSTKRPTHPWRPTFSVELSSVLLTCESMLLTCSSPDLLVENEALRSALHVQPPSSQAGGPSNTPKLVASPSLSPSTPASGSMPHYHSHPGRGGKFCREARRIAVERYRQKRKRRLECQSTNGPRYVKMKAVADGKLRNASGKFVKRDNQVVLVAPEPASVSVAEAPQICEVEVFVPAQPSPCGANDQ
eukprot:TRINITY_DN295_c0_g1_i9.p1 TRINITY_DN295_c0_g1~~TRINITY_DN295_c0_g1_i9.p1  ORF type:complete len:209 (-),score=16.62 TRINITY_DN295_c0_g1_i9:497-1123(-)